MPLSKEFKTRDKYLQDVYNDYKNGGVLITDEIIKHFTDKNIKDTSKDNQISSFKGFLLKVRSSPEAKKLFLPKETRDSVRETQANSFANRKKLKIKRSYVKKLLKLLKSDDYYDISVGLLLACGRREMELMDLVINPIKKDSEIYKDFMKMKITKNDNNILLFSGQTKTKNKIDYYIPLLVTRKAFVTAYDKFKILKPEQSLDYILRKTRDRLKYTVKNMDIVLHDLRRIYAMEVRKRYTETNKEETINVATFIQMILGHESPEVSIKYNMIEFV